MRTAMRLAAVVLSCLSLSGMMPVGAQVPQELPPPTPKSVVSFIDSGINPYHEVFRDTGPWAYQHPSTYIPGYPADAVALPITLPPLGEAANWADLVQEDCAVWETVQPDKLYWFPGTRIIGGISFDPWIEPFSGCGDLPATGAEILDYQGHGTMVASRGASNQYGACLATDCRVRRRFRTEPPPTSTSLPTTQSGGRFTRSSTASRRSVPGVL